MFYRRRLNHVRFVVQRTRTLFTLQQNRIVILLRSSISTYWHLNCGLCGLCLWALFKNWSAILRPAVGACAAFTKTSVRSLACGQATHFVTARTLR